MLKKIKNKLGFTMSELLTVIALLSILAAVAIPILSKQLEHSREISDIALMKNVEAMVLTENIDNKDETRVYYYDALKNKLIKEVNFRENSIAGYGKGTAKNGGVESFIVGEGSDRPMTMEWVNVDGTDASNSGEFYTSSIPAANKILKITYGTDTIVDNSVVYNVVKGANQKCDVNKDLSFTTNIPFSKFKSVKINNHAVSTTDFVATEDITIDCDGEGGTVITFHKDYTQSLSRILYDIDIVAVDSKASTTFKMICYDNNKAMFTSRFINPGCHDAKNPANPTLSIIHVSECYEACNDTLTWEDLQKPENGEKYGYKTSVVTDDGIGNNAFKDCKGLSYINIPESVTSIGDYAFYSCTSLQSAVIPDSVTSMGTHTFDFCRNLSIVNIPSNLIKIPYTAFHDCDALTSIVVPDTVTSINAEAFYECDNLTDIYIPETVTYIGRSAFKGTPWLAAKQAENPMVVVNNILVDGNKLTGDVVIPSDIKSISPYSFGPNDNITSVVIPEGIKEIGELTFHNCSSLANVTIPASVKSISSDAFIGTPWLAAKQEENPLVIMNGILFNGNKATGDVVIPEGVISIEPMAFDMNYDITSVVIPSSIDTLQTLTFRICKNITSITIPNSVKRIEDYVCFSSSKLSTINYNGTIEEWNLIEKGTYWDSNTGQYTIYCTDGEITK